MSSPNGTPEFDGRPTREDLAKGPRGFYEYRGSIPLMELPVEAGPSFDDFEWARRNRELHRQYQGLIVAVCDRKVWGVGVDGNAARDDALQKPGCPERHKLTFLTVVGMPGPSDEGERRSRE